MRFIAPYSSKSDIISTHKSAEETSLVGDCMRSAAEILAELGFNKNASKGSQEAFLKHLFKNAKATSAQKLSTNLEQAQVGEQLSFAADLLGTATAEATPRRSHRLTNTSKF